MRSPVARRAGFTLLEMSIVLVVIGLIVGGIFTGQELYRPSQVNSIATDLNRMQSAIGAFKLKYSALPGDMSDATRFFGTPTAGCPNGAGTGTQTCNGNADGFIADPTGTTYHYESLRAWQHLAAAGLIPNPAAGYFTGVPGALGYTGAYGDHRIGVNAPTARIKKVGYALFYIPRIAVGSAHGWLYAGTYNNAILVGGENPGYEPADAAFTPSEAYGLDKKFDDASPGLGRLVTRHGGNQPNCSNGLTATSATATYNTTYNAKACVFYFRQATD